MQQSLCRVHCVGTIRPPLHCGEVSVGARLERVSKKVRKAAPTYYRFPINQEMR